MSSDLDSDQVFTGIYDMFVENLHHAKQYFEAFDRYDTRMEGWFHGQMLILLSQESRQGWRLLTVNKKVDDDGGRPDLRILSGQQRLRIEIKSMIIDSRTLSMYFRKSFGKDLRKMRASREPMRLITVAFPITDEGKWKELVDRVNNEYESSPYCSEDISYPPDRKARVTMWKKEKS